MPRLKVIRYIAILSGFSVTLVSCLVPLDSAVYVDGRIVSESGEELGECLMALYRHPEETSLGEGLILTETTFHEGYPVQNPNKSDYYAVISCEGSDASFRSPVLEAVWGRDYAEEPFDLGTITFSRSSAVQSPP